MPYKDLPQNPEQMRSASVADLEKVLNVPRENFDMIEGAHEAVDEIKKRGLEIKGAGEGPYTIQSKL